MRTRNESCLMKIYIDKLILDKNTWIRLQNFYHCYANVFYNSRNRFTLTLSAIDSLIRCPFIVQRTWKTLPNSIIFLLAVDPDPELRWSLFICLSFTTWTISNHLNYLAVWHYRPIALSIWIIGVCLTTKYFVLFDCVFFVTN